MRYLTTLAENEQQLKNIRAGLELKLKSRRAALEEADRAEQQLNRELDAARQRLSVLRELEKNMEGYQNSVKTVMRAASPGGCGASSAGVLHPAGGAGPGGRH